MRKVLIAVDLQIDFITGSLVTPEAQAILPAVREKLAEREKEGWEIVFTRDTHFDDYLSTREGRLLPVPHCLKDSWGWQVEESVDMPEKRHVNKLTFGYTDWDLEGADEVELIGLCTDICVVSNALVIKAKYPELDVWVDPACCAGVTPAAHEAALATMRSCQVLMR